MKQALFVGRFQPFHLGHLSVIKNALKKEDRLIIVIGSAEENHEPPNPFTSGERFQMIEAALDAEKIPRSKYAIIPIRNVENFMLWTAHVDQYIPPIYKVYTGSKIVKELYQNYGKYKIEDVKMFGCLCDAKKISGPATAATETAARTKAQKTEIRTRKCAPVSGTEIRDKMLKNDKSWETCVHPAVVKLIKKWKGLERLKMINS